MPKSVQNYHTIALISHASKVMIKIIQANQIWKRHVHHNVHRSTVYNSQDMEAS